MKESYELPSLEMVGRRKRRIECRVLVYQVGFFSQANWFGRIVCLTHPTCSPLEVGWVKFAWIEFDSQNVFHQELFRLNIGLTANVDPPSSKNRNRL